jgi:DNA-binding SARP family transcriptional activator
VLPSPPEGSVEFRILGPLEVVDRGRQITLGGSRQRALLALLLTRANEVVSTDRLIDELWGAEPPTTPANALQYHVSQLRKALAPSDVIVTREPGYLIRVGRDELDLLRFERLVAEAELATPDRAAEALREALGLWRGPPLADLADQPFVQSEIRRLEEVRLAALEQRVEVDLALGRHVQVIPELETLVREHPFRERLRAALMRALYGAGRQAEALNVYRETRQTLVDELGIEPSPTLQELERAILRQDPALAPEGDTVRPERAILVLVTDEDRVDELLRVAEPLARMPVRELILARLLRDQGDLAAATAQLAERRSALAQRGVPSRVAAYTTTEPGDDVALLATQYSADLLLVAASRDVVASGRFDADREAILEQAPCDVAVLAGRDRVTTGPVASPFGGVDHDWSAIEVAAWLAQSLGTTLRLVGTAADATRGRRDASRLLARASMLVQQMVGIVTEPVLTPTGEEGLLEAARDACVLVIGLSDRWRTEGIGPVRLAVAAGANVPTLFVRSGLRPSGIAPPETLTRFTWTLGSQNIGSAS